MKPTIGKYILKDGKVVPERDLMKWARWIEEHQKECRVGEFQNGKVRVSTVFLGIDYNFRSKGKPLVFETMIFGGKHDHKMWRHTSLRRAKKAHEMIVAWVLSGLPEELSLSA